MRPLLPLDSGESLHLRGAVDTALFLSGGELRRQIAMLVEPAMRDRDEQEDA